MRVSIVLEQRFLHTASGATYNDGHATYLVWVRYLAVFEEVQLVGRSQLVEVVPTGYQRVDGAGVRVYHLPSYQGPRQLLRKLPQVIWALYRAFEPQDVVIFRISGILANLATPLLTWRRQAFAAEVINDPYLAFGGERPASRTSRILRWAFTAQAQWQCRRAVAVQYVTRRALQRRYPARPGAATFGVSDVHLPPDAFAAPRTYDRAAHRAVLVGSLDQDHKAVDVVLRALAMLRGEGRDVHFTLVGDGLLRPETEALAHKLGVWEHCDFVGQRATPVQVRADLVRADLFLIPSRTEGMPRALLEAMAQGLPAIGSDVGGMPELLPPELLAVPGDVDSLVSIWRALMNDPARLSEASARNVEVAAGYADAVLDEQRSAFLRAVRAASSPPGGTGHSRHPPRTPARSPENK